MCIHIWYIYIYTHLYTYIYIYLYESMLDSPRPPYGGSFMQSRVKRATVTVIASSNMNSNMLANGICNADGCVRSDVIWGCAWDFECECECACECYLQCDWVCAFECDMCMRLRIRMWLRMCLRMLRAMRIGKWTRMWHANVIANVRCSANGYVISKVICSMKQCHSAFDRHQHEHLYREERSKSAYIDFVVEQPLNNFRFPLACLAKPLKHIYFQMCLKVFVEQRMFSHLLERSLLLYNQVLSWVVLTSC